MKWEFGSKIYHLNVFNLLDKNQIYLGYYEKVTIPLVSSHSVSYLCVCSKRKEFFYELSNPSQLSWQ